MCFDVSLKLCAVNSLSTTLPPCTLGSFHFAPSSRERSEGGSWCSHGFTLWMLLRDPCRLTVSWTHGHSSAQVLLPTQLASLWAPEPYLQHPCRPGGPRLTTATSFGRALSLLTPQILPVGGNCPLHKGFPCSFSLNSRVPSLSCQAVNER